MSQDAPKQDPRLQPTPDYGSLGPGTDISAKTIDPKQRVGRLRAIAIVCGVVGALVFQFVGSEKGRAAWEQFQELISLHGKPEPASPAVLSGHELEKLENSSAQKQAELLLERAVNHYEGANDEIAARVDGWRGKIKLTNRLNSLAIAAINSNDLRVRAAAIEIDLAAYGLEKTRASVDQLEQQAASSDRPTRIWALWVLGLMANRGVETARVTQSLLGHLNDNDVETRHWAVEGLAIVGTDETLQPLLKTMHDDPSQMVRERAACSLAQSGMLKQEQRMSIVPQLLEFADDTSLDTATRAFTFHALRDITGKNLPDNAAVWHDWYNSR